ncbi:hypothetical protein ACTXT7_012591 [Hymenolepis weldensis]
MALEQIESLPQGLRVNADSYMETLQSIVKPPWIDSVTTGRSPLHSFLPPSLRLPTGFASIS